MYYAICGRVKNSLKFEKEDGSVDSVESFGEVKSETIKWGVGFVAECLMEAKGPEDVSAAAVSASTLSWAYKLLYWYSASVKGDEL